MEPVKSSRWKMRRGVAYLEYALLAALIGIVGAVGVMKYGKDLLKLGSCKFLVEHYPS